IDRQRKKNRAAFGFAAPFVGEIADGRDRARLEASPRRGRAAGARRVAGSGCAAAETIWAREPVPAWRAAVWRDVEIAAAIRRDATRGGSGGAQVRSAARVRKRAGVFGVSCRAETFAGRARARVETRVRRDDDGDTWIVGAEDLFGKTGDEPHLGER